MRRLRHILALAVLSLALLACARPAPEHTPEPAKPFRLALLHVNDTHSALEPAEAQVTLAGRKVAARLGGFARLKTALDEARARAGAEGVPTLTLHAGDAVQGTLFFNVFQGSADFEFLNLLGIDAMTLGNHEFDKGPGLTGKLVGMARFPVVSANIDASGEPALAGKLRPYVIREVAGRDGAIRKVGIVGVTTPGTPNLVASVGGVKFHKSAPAVAKAVEELADQGVDIVLVLSHLGYEADLALARAVPGLDVIVGGHSHTLLGDAARFRPLGLTPAGPYPTVVPGPNGGTALIVQAWRWGMALGELSVDFDALGRVTGWKGQPTLLAGAGFKAEGADISPAGSEYPALLAALTASGAAREVREDPDIAAKLRPYAEKLDTFRHAPIGATAAESLVRGTASDPGPIVADAYRAAVPGARAALLMPGNVRADLFQGALTLGQIMGVLPFGNTLVALDLTGAELKSALEDAAEFKLRVRPSDVADLRRATVLHASGLSCAIRADAPRGQRIRDLRIQNPDGSFTPVDPSATYRVVTNSFLAGGGDGAATLKNAPRREDTGILETDALTDHLRGLGIVRPVRPESRVRVVIEAGGGKISWIVPAHAHLRRAA